MINLFDIAGGKPVPSVHCHFIPHLKKIMEEFPVDYLKVYAYIFYLTCPDGTMNAYINQPEDQREQIILADLKPEFDLENKWILAAIEKCKKMYETPTLRIVVGAKKMLDEMATKLGEQLTFGKNGNATDMRGIMKEIRGYTEDYLILENKLKEEQSKVRGGVKLRYDFQPGYIDSKADTDEPE